MSAEETTDERASILLVDDMEDNLMALEAVLGSLNEPLIRARSGEEAMKALLRRRFAVVLLDIRMPGMDGFETAANIKRLDQTKDVPIIFLTGTDADAGYAFRGYATGAADYLTKPFDPWVLRAKVSVFLDLHRKNRQLERMLAREQERFDELAARLREIGTRVASSDHQEVLELRHHVQQMEELLRGMRQGGGGGGPPPPPPGAGGGGGRGAPPPRGARAHNVFFRRA
ncbi:response regulator, partial [Streptomyces avermitilis]|uniref:response regulator n=1 Tax=Streptomyces avermitilis TaxID=33903 RepID=UPI003CD09B9B